MLLSRNIIILNGFLKEQDYLNKEELLVLHFPAPSDSITGAVCLSSPRPLAGDIQWSWG